MLDDHSFIHLFNKSLLIASYILSILPVLRHPFQEKKKNKHHQQQKLREEECFTGDGKKRKYSSLAVSIL